MVSELRFDGRVVVITGAGAGLGRAYALLFGERGAAVVVNDLGGGRHGDGSSTKAADTVVQEIKDRGGRAVPDYNSVEDGHKIIQTALDSFGRVDVVVNNAGILRDKSFARISDDDWELIHRVHVKGTFKTTQAAWPHFRKQNYGRVIVTSSNSGLCGNFGQANYSAAKLAVVGLSNTLAIEGSKNNIQCNVIVPTAASRLTEDILPPDLFAELRPELIAPVVVWLCHESCQENGSIIESAAGWAGKCHLVRSRGTALRTSLLDAVTPEAVRDRWAQVTDMEAAQHVGSIEEASGALMSVLEEMKSSGEAGKDKEVTERFSFGKRDLILYALAVGASVQRADDLRFLYEGHDAFSALPTFAVIPGVVAVMGSSLVPDVFPDSSVDLSKILHGEQFLEVLQPLHAEDTLTSHCRVADVLDKGSGAVVLVDVHTYNSQGEKVAYCQLTTFVVGAGGFGGKRTSEHAVPVVAAPDRTPDMSVRQATCADQAALYRLCGDWNPLHIDSQLATMAGFPRPILHGLCSLGFSARHVLQTFAANDPSKLRAIKVRFAKPVLPGETLQTDMWQNGNRIHFQTTVVESRNVVISGAYVDLTETVTPAKMQVQTKKLLPQLKSDAVFKMMKQRMDANLDKVKKIKGIFLYIITVGGKKAAAWTVDLRAGRLYPGEPQGKVDTTLTVDDQDMVDLASGKLNPQVAFMKGKLKISGNVMLTQKLQALMKEEAKL